MKIDSGLGWCRLCAQVSADIGQHHRYAHSVRVARTAELLALRHGVNTHDARIAGLLHDLARLWSTERLLTECARRGYQPNDFEYAHPIVLHAPIGAALARENYGINNHGILQAIERHTLGAADMSPLDAIIYLADALEPGRNFAERADLLALAMDDLQAGLNAVYSSTKRHFESKGQKITPEVNLARIERILP